MTAQARHAAIQVHEAELERALVGNAPVDCEGRAGRVEEATAASAAICQLSGGPRGARDVDAAVRCERATRRATDARRDLDAACGS